jgi:hypothetical protein
LLVRGAGRNPGLVSVSDIVTLTSDPGVSPRTDTSVLASDSDGDRIGHVARHQEHIIAALLLEPMVFIDVIALKNSDAEYTSSMRGFRIEVTTSCDIGTHVERLVATLEQNDICFRVE